MPTIYHVTLISANKIFSFHKPGFMRVCPFQRLPYAKDRPLFMRPVSEGDVGQSASGGQVIPSPYLTDHQKKKGEDNLALLSADSVKRILSQNHPSRLQPRSGM